MNRLLILVAACALGTGCVSHDTCDVRTLHVRWDSFQLADGSTSNSCTSASLRADPQIQYADVLLDGQFVADQLFPCTWYGVDIDNVGTGSHELIVEGLDSSRHIVLRDWVSFNASDSCSDIALDTVPAEGYAQIDYRFTQGGQPVVPNACEAGSVIEFSILDTLAENAPAYADGSNIVSCSASNAGLIPLAAFGSYQLKSLQEVQGSTVKSSACSLGTAFDVDAAKTTEVGPFALDLQAPACPR